MQAQFSVSELLPDAAFLNCHWLASPLRALTPVRLFSSSGTVLCKVSGTKFKGSGATAKDDACEGAKYLLRKGKEHVHTFKNVKNGQMPVRVLRFRRECRESLSSPP